jgi:hypothetical protein
VNAIPGSWVVAAHTVLEAHRPPVQLPQVTAATLAAARAEVCANLGWFTRAGQAVRLESLTVALATKIQLLPAVTAISARHEAFMDKVRAFDARQSATGNVALPEVNTVLARWWKLRVPNNYKEAAWRLTLNAFPTSARMHGNNTHVAGCVACDAPVPDVGHHFWTCPVAVVLRHEIESQLRAHPGTQLLAPGGSLSCAALWLGVKPHSALHRMTWDMVCLAAAYALDVGRRAAWSVSRGGLQVPVLVEAVAGRASKAAFWDALSDFAVSASVARSARSGVLTRQPFIAWHTVVAHGSGLRVVRH